MCDICLSLGDENPINLNPEQVLAMIAKAMASAKGKKLDHLTELVDKVIGFAEPKSQETASGLMPEWRDRTCRI